MTSYTGVFMTSYTGVLMTSYTGVLMTSYTGVFMTSYTGFAGFRFQVEFTFGLYGRSLMCGSAPISMSFCAFVYFLFLFLFLQLVCVVGL
jgi:hypothetical protein